MTLTQITKIRGPGIHTTSNIVSHNINSSGIITAVAFKGPFTGSSDIQSGILTATKIDLNGDIDVDGHTELDNVNISGLTTAALLNVSNLTNGRVTYAAASGRLVDSANLTFNGSNLTVGGNVNAVDGAFSGNVSIGGTLTYEDVTNIDSVGIITARDGLKVLAGGANVVGVVTATTFKGDGDFVELDVDGHTNLDNVSISGFTTITQDLDVDGHTNLDNVSVGGATTISDNLKVTANVEVGLDLDVDGHTNLDNVSIAGVVTATTFKGDGDFVELDVDGHTNLDNVSIAGVVTATSFVGAVTGAVTGTASGNPTLANGANNRVVTATGANALTGESNFTFDGSKISITGSQNSYLSNNILWFDRAGYSYIDQLNDNGSLVFRVTSGYTNALRLDNNAQAIFGGNLLIPDAIQHVGDLDCKIRFPGTDTISFETASNERLRIKSDGNVGIGTDNPQVKLTVSSTSPAVCDIHHIDGGTNDEARIILGALALNPPSNRGAGIAAVNNGAGHDLIIKCSASHSVGPTEKLRIHSNGDITVPSGSIKLSESGQGINFHNFGSGTDIDSNLFDDYEEGSWTPVPARYTGGNANLSMSTQVGKYTKIGNMIRLEFYIVISSVTSQGGSLTQLRGLPFLPNASYMNTGVCFYNDGFQHDDDTDYTIITTVHSDNGGVVYFKANGCDAGNGLSTKNFQAGTITGSCTYRTDS